MRAFVVVISGLLVSAPAFAQGVGGGPTGSGAQMATDAAEAPENAASASGEGDGTERRICRRVETATGSRMSYRRICMTADQWRNFNRQN